MPPDQLDPFNGYIVAHAVLMFLAWGFFAPLGLAIAIFFKSHPWFRLHFYLMPIFVLGLTVVGLAMSVTFIASQGLSSFTNYHEIIGLTVVCSAAVQGILGYYIHHLFNPNRTKRPARNQLHIWLGRCVFVLAVVNVAFGIQRYGQWYGLSETTDRYLYGYVGYIIGWPLGCAVLAWLLRRRSDREREMGKGEGTGVK